MEEGKKSSNSQRRRRRNNRSKKAKPPGDRPAQNNGKKANSKSSGNRSSRNRKRNNNRKKVKLFGIDLVMAKYQTLLEGHLQIRAKYFNGFHRVNLNERTKLENRFYDSIEKLRSYQDTVPEEFLHEFKNRVNCNELDLTYSDNHGINAEHIEVEYKEGTHEDPHYLESQMSSEFKDDNEESSGTYEDYKKYKGID